MTVAHKVSAARESIAVKRQQILRVSMYVLFF